VVSPFKGLLDELLRTGECGGQDALIVSTFTDFISKDLQDSWGGYLIGQLKWVIRLERICRDHCTHDQTLEEVLMPSPSCASVAFTQYHISAFDSKNIHWIPTYYVYVSRMPQFGREYTIKQNLTGSDVRRALRDSVVCPH